MVIRWTDKWIIVSILYRKYSVRGWLLLYLEVPQVDTQVVCTEVGLLVGVDTDGVDVVGVRVGEYPARRRFHHELHRLDYRHLHTVNIKLIKIILLVLIHLHRIQNGVKSFKSIHLSVILLWSIKNGRQTFSIQEVFFVSSCQLFSLVLNYSYSGDVFRYLGRKLKSFFFITLFCAHGVSRGIWEGHRPRHVTSPRLHM